MKLAENIGEFTAPAKEWVNTGSDNLFSDCKGIAICAIAEYMANLRGLTIYPHRSDEK